jgi:CubicO group peptidase (beta-lactamase class C family)
LSLTPRDAAKFGLLYLNGGKYGGRQVVSAEWVRDSLSKRSVVNDTDYGYLWWRQWLSVRGRRVDGVTAKGNGGQRIYLWPDLNMVAVVTGGGYNKQSRSDQLLAQYILPPFAR